MVKETEMTVEKVGESGERGRLSGEGIVTSSRTCPGPVLTLAPKPPGVNGGLGGASAGVAEVASTRSNYPRLNLGREVRVGAWNVRSLRHDDRLPLLSRELGRLRVEVAALSKVRRPSSGMTSVGGYTYYRSGHSDGHHLQGVAIAISSRLQPSVVEVTPVDERIMVLRLKLSFLLHVSYCCVRSYQCDLNAVSGCDRAGYEMSVGPHGSETDAGIENSLLFRDFARSQKLRISGSWVYRSAEFCGTDHRLVVVTLRIHFKTP
ncbi:uncharacterized protein [Penaeus vannamei]|uniref:uncharacterized protein n=1 Tax=Penaeus vannamei TaxID=6689 RepID=UPI00387FAD3B